MKFRRSRVYTVLNADELGIGSSVILGDTVSELKTAVKKEYSIQKLIAVYGEDTPYRFIGDQDYSVHSLAYLVEPYEDINFVTNVDARCRPFYPDISFENIIIRSIETPAGKIGFISLLLTLGLLYFVLFK